MNRNTGIGFALIFLILVGYYYLNPTPPATSPQQQKTATSANKLAVDSSLAKQATAMVADTLVNANDKASYGAFAALTNVNTAVPKTVVLQNTDIIITIATKGAVVEKVELKNYKSYDGNKLILFDSASARQEIVINSIGGKADISKIYFTTSAITANSVTFTANGSDGSTIKQIYSLTKDGGYTVTQKLSYDKAVENTDVIFSRVEKIKRLEKDVNNSRTTSTVNFYTADGTFDNIGESTLDEKTKLAESSVKWVSFKQRFFNTGIIAEIPFQKAEFKSFTNQNDVKDIKTLEAKFSASAKGLATGLNFTWYFGPNKFKVLQGVTEGFDKNVYLGYPVINLVNRYIVVNVFYFLESFISNYGIIIIILVILLKILLLPLTYKSFISMAKMKVLKPEIDEIKARNGDDMAKIQQEQMKLYGQVGINPLSGCIPLLLQLPILLAMFNFFPNSIELRQQSFLWASDLSTYDSIATLPFSLPSYGDHVSLFTILMTISTLVLTFYNNQSSTVTGPMQTIGYVMPVFFMFILNSLPAGLNFYYLVSNVISIVQQIAIKSTVNDASIRQKLEDNKVKLANKPVGKFRQKLDEVMRQAEETKRIEKGKK